MRHILKIHRSLTDPLPTAKREYQLRTFDPAGFFLAVKDQEIVGFCWTKIHQDFVNQEPVGELYVVGVDPDHAHQGIGRAVSVAAINYLVTKGLKHSMLYVDADNEKGLALYTSLGFN